jgi:hypothetical protein
MDIYSGPDSLGVYLTGAASDGAAQSVPGDSLGGYRSSSEVSPCGWQLSSPCGGIFIDAIGFGNDTGSAEIRAASGSFYYSPPGIDEGEGIALTDDSSGVLTGATGSGSVRITRDLALSPTGTLVFTIVDIFGGAIGGRNLTNAERTDGVTTYRAVMLRAHGAYGVLDIKAWVGSDTDTQSTISLGYETPDGDGAIQTIADEETAPSGISWDSGTTEGTGLYHKTIDVSHNLGLWIKRESPSSSDAAAKEKIQVCLSFFGV